jgi:hypothetical protein
MHPVTYGHMIDTEASLPQHPCKAVIAQLRAPVSPNTQQSDVGAESQLSSPGAWKYCLDSRPPLNGHAESHARSSDEPHSSPPA